MSGPKPERAVFVVWSSTDAAVGLNAGVFYSYRLAGGGFFAAPTLSFRSSTYYTDFRWGDYSACSLDPTDVTGKTFWAVNETILGFNH